MGYLDKEKKQVVWINEDAPGTSLEYFSNSNDYYAEWVNPFLDLYRERGDGKIIGFQVNWLNKLLKEGKKEIVLTEEEQEQLDKTMNNLFGPDKIRESNYEERE